MCLRGCGPNMGAGLCMVRGRGLVGGCGLNLGAGFECKGAGIHTVRGRGLNMGAGLCYGKGAWPCGWVWPKLGGGV